MSLIPPDDEEITTQIKTLRNNSAPGHDKVRGIVLKMLTATVTPILTHLIKTIFLSGTYPTTYKLATVVPIHKAGSPSLIENYRLVSILSTPSKVVEGILFKRLSDFFVHKQKQLFCIQYGFREKCSTETAAIELSEVINKSIDTKKFVTGVFMDLRKAFDAVNHNTLIEVLEKYGVRGQVLAPFHDYLQNRRQVVKIGDCTSHEEKICSGVFQGSRLGPLLFLIFINAVGSLPISGKLFLFADDAVLINEHDLKDREKAEVFLQKIVPLTDLPKSEFKNS
jgi:hypothetical protein